MEDFFDSLINNLCMSFLAFACVMLISVLITSNHPYDVDKSKNVSTDLSESYMGLSEGHRSLSEEYRSLSEEYRRLSEEYRRLSEEYRSLSLDLEK